MPKLSPQEEDLQLLKRMAMLIGIGFSLGVGLLLLVIVFSKFPR
ncbi:MAG: hypothetical protein ACOVQA_01810 [Thermoflexibacteraceae bacterium]|jgi:hypothetical protein